MKKQRILVRVTKEDIDAGLRCQHDNCPVAIAIGRETNFGYVSVGPKWLLLGHFSHKQPTPQKTPASVAKFVRQFDDNKKPKPFNFYLTLPE